MKYKVSLVSILFIYSLLPGISLAQNKVVVIPLTKETPLEPYAELANPSPPNSAYTEGTGTVTDNVTGLEWQREDNNEQKTWYDALEYCQGENFGGKTDWRLPSIEELMSIVDYGDSSPPTINSVFTGTNPSDYWSATTRVGNAGVNAWYINFDWAYKGSQPKGGVILYVRCVRGNFIRDNMFKNNGNGTVTDLATGHMWQREDDNNKRAWDKAHAYCQQLSLGGKQDWRLPNVKELHSIIDSRVYNPAINSITFPGTTGDYWSATTDVNDIPYMWSVDFNDGYVDSENPSTTSYRVRCVR